jgi:dimethylargininase
MPRTRSSSWDALVIFADLAVLTRSGAPARRAEQPSVRATIDALSYDCAEIVAPATLDGGDVLRSGSTVYVGCGDRTNQGGFAQLSAHLVPRGARIVKVPLEPVLHLKSALGALPDGSLVGWKPLPTKRKPPR